MYTNFAIMCLLKIYLHDICSPLKTLGSSQFCSEEKPISDTGLKSLYNLALLPSDLISYCYFLLEVLQSKGGGGGGSR